MGVTKPFSLLLCGWLLALACAAPAAADSYRCGRKLVRTGDSSADLLRACGEPALKDRGREQIRHEGKRIEVPVERWHYRKSPRSLERIVLIYRGRVAAIRTGGR